MGNPQSKNEAYKFDPDAETYVTIPLGKGPYTYTYTYTYTYSDMTGVQLTTQNPIL